MNKVLHNIQDDPTVEGMASTPTIYAALEGRQVDHKATMVKIEGKVSNTSISIFIDPGVWQSYVSPNVTSPSFVNTNKIKYMSICNYIG